jgi:hypothetical protein
MKSLWNCGINPDRLAPGCDKRRMNAVDIGGVEGSVKGQCHNGVPRCTTNRLWGKLGPIGAQ